MSFDVIQNEPRETKWVPVGTIAADSVPPSGPEVAMGQAMRRSPEDGLVVSYRMCRTCGNWFNQNDPQMRSESRCVSCCRTFCTRCDYTSCIHRRTDNVVSGAVVPVLHMKIPNAYSMADEAGIEYQHGRTAQYRKTLSGWPEFNRFVCVFGPQGCGKTYVGYAVKRRLGCKGTNATFVSTIGEAGLHSRWQKSRSYSSNERFPDIQAAYLILDEFGGISPDEIGHSAWVQFIHGLLEYRISNNLPTLLLSSQSRKKLATMYGEDVKSRLQLFRPVVLKEIDRRGDSERNQDQEAVESETEAKELVETK